MIIKVTGPDEDMYLNTEQISYGESVEEDGKELVEVTMVDGVMLVVYKLSLDTQLVNQR